MKTALHRTRPKPVAVDRTQKRVAIYTRQSVEDSTSEFTSLHAQREAVEAFVLSQRREGWTANPEHFDDAGISGARASRPALDRLFEAIRAGRVDIVAVYKIDRLSRRIADLLQFVREFDEHKVSFVSITQSFNTATNTGRLMLNVLASFGEFERQEIAERTRDKIGAARKRGMWTGGRPPLGYDLREKKLVVNETEAALVREIFSIHARLQSVTATVQELKRRGVRSKSFKNKHGKHVLGGYFDKQSLRTFLRSPLFVGRMRLGRETFPGAHQPIVETTVWDAAQLALSGPDDRPAWTRPMRTPVLLRGLLHCGVCGAAMVHTYAGKKGKKYTYYQCSTAATQGASACPKSRVPVGKIDTFVVEQIRAIGGDRTLVRETLAAAKVEFEKRLPELSDELSRHERDAKRLNKERTKLLSNIADAGPASRAVVEHVAKLDDDAQRAGERARAARDAIQVATAGEFEEDALRAALAEFNDLWDALFPAERARVISLLIERINFTGATGDIEIRFRPNGLGSLS